MNDPVFVFIVFWLLSVFIGFIFGISDAWRPKMEEEDMLESIRQDIRSAQAKLLSMNYVPEYAPLQQALVKALASLSCAEEEVSGEHADRGV